MGVYYPKKNASEKLKNLSTTPILSATLILAAAVEGGRQQATYTPHTRWCEASAERPMGKNQFGEELVQHGYEPEKRGGVRGWNGVELKPEFALSLA
jgi:hypothetical protein